MRRLAVSLALACAAGAQVAPAPGFLASLLAHAIHGDDHAHAVVLVADRGHLDLVLAHGAEEDHPHAGAPRDDDRHTPPSETDHVFHIAVDDAANTTPRRADVSPAVPLAVAAPPTPLLAWALRPSAEPRARSFDPLRSGVLRL
jgi:hypothetical protein